VFEEQVGGYPGHRPPVLHDVGHARRGPQVVLEHPEGAGLVTDQVDAGDVDAHPVRWHDACRFAVEVLARGHQPFRHDAVAEDVLLAVHVVEEHLERPHPLGDAAFELGPFRGGDHPWNEIERERPFLPQQGERDTLVGEGPAERLGPRGQIVRPLRFEDLRQPAIGRADPAVAVEHLVVGGCGDGRVRIPVEDVGRRRPAP
jgi:hypothetical protein